MALLQNAAKLGVVTSSFDLTPKQAIDEFYRRDPGGDIDRIYAEVRRIVDTPAMSARLSEIGFEITEPIAPAALAAAARTSYATFDRVLTQAGIKPE